MRLRGRIESLTSRTITIAIDGPAAAGKSTVAKLVANHLSFIYIDTGAMYRALTLHALREGINPNDEQTLAQALSTIDIELKQHDTTQQVLLNQDDVTFEIRKPDVTNHVSNVAKHPKIRQVMVKKQQALAAGRSVVMDGRDIGTYVLPNADLKFFLKASVEERARRRFKENQSKGISSDFDELKKEIEQRDLNDSNREIAPLIKAEDAIEIDTTSLTIEQVVQVILDRAHQIIETQTPTKENDH